MLRLQGYDPKTLINEVSANHSPGVKYGEKQEVDEITSENIGEHLSNIFNEVSYDESPEFVSYFNNPSFTKYDKGTLLQRFPNIVALCNDYFGQSNASDKVFLSTLPLTQINGLNVKFDNDETVIFLNEGLLYASQFLIRDFYKIPFHTDNVGPNGDLVMSEEERLDFSRTCPIFLDSFLTYMSDMVTTNTMMDGKSKHLPSAHENWKFHDSLKEEVEKNLFKLHGTIPSKPSRSRREKMFYISKGFFILLVGHEYSHHFRGHHNVRIKGESTLDQLAMHRILRELRENGHNVSFPDAMNPYFSLYQPLEVEADMDAINILQKYCDDNQLNREQIDDLTYGFILCFIFMEFNELFLNAKKYNAQYADDLNNMDQLYRNIISSSEHLCPMSRVVHAIENANDFSSDFITSYITNMEHLSFKAKLMWNFALPNIEKILRKIEFSEPIDLGGMEFTKSFSAMGHILNRD